MGVLDLQQCLGRWCIHMNTKIHSFSAECCTEHHIDSFSGHLGVISFSDHQYTCTWPFTWFTWSIATQPNMVHCLDTLKSSPTLPFSAIFIALAILWNPSRWAKLHSPHRAISFRCPDAITRRAYWLSFLRPLLVATNYCILKTSHKICCFWDVLTQLSSHDELAHDSLRCLICLTGVELMWYFILL